MTQIRCFTTVKLVVKKAAKNFINFFISSELALVLFTEILISIAISLVSLYVFLHISEGVLEKEFANFDMFIIRDVVSMRSPQVTGIMLGITNLASPLTLFVASVIMIIYLYTKRKKDAFIFSAILYSAVIVNLILKGIFAIPRPQYLPLIKEVYYSFPSGHAMNSFVFFLSLTYFIYRETKSVKAFVFSGIISAVLVFGTGFSRIYLGVHYPSDVIAGFIAGGVWFLSAIALEKTVIFERLYRSSKFKK